MVKTKARNPNDNMTREINNPREIRIIQGEIIPTGEAIRGKNDQ